MKVYPLLYAVIVISAFFGCGHTREIFLPSPQMPSASLYQVNRETRNQTVRLVLQDGRSFMAQITRIAPDSTFWQTRDSKITGVARTAEISRMTFKSRKKGALHGLMIGPVITLPTAIMSNDVAEGKADRGSVIRNGVLAGVIWGAGIGALVGSRRTYVFIAPKDVQTPIGGP